MTDTLHPAVEQPAHDSMTNPTASLDSTEPRAAETTLATPSQPAATADTTAVDAAEPTAPTTSLAVPTEATQGDASSSASPLTRSLTEALGPATDDVIVAPSQIQGMPVILALTLQLTTGARHPYKIDQKYLANRKVEALTDAGDFDPREISGYKLKELIWTDWRSEWEPRPASPSSIRLIYMGKLLEDKKALKEYNLALESPSIVHMTIKPAEFDEDETAAKGNKSGSVRARDGEDRDAGCRCVVL